ncbi:MAG: thioredoxin domain-containing protein [Candidatus Magasanikiibacteriota bacterium]
MEPINSSDYIQLKKPWYKTVGGIFFLVIIGLIVVGVVGFMALFSYYSVQIKYGGLETKDKLDKQFGYNFTVDTSRANGAQGKNIVTDYAKYTREHDPVFGSNEAKVTVLAFIDFECQYSRQAYFDFKKMMNKYEPVIKVIHKDFPLITLNPNALLAAEAGRCAHGQGVFWPYHDLVFQSTELNKNVFLSLAKNLQLDESIFSTCLDSGKYIINIDEDISDATILGVRGTPTYFVNGVRFEGVLSLEDWDKIILSFLNNK